MKSFIYSILILFASISFLHGQVPSFDWAKHIGGMGTDYGYASTMDAAGNIYVTGSFQGTATFGSGFSLTSFGAEDCFVAKYDITGAFNG